MKAATTLLAAAAGWLCASACDLEPKAPPPASGRVQAVVAKAPDERDLAGFCDVTHPSGQGEPLRLPALIEGQWSHRGAGGHWVNLWATWCKPCLEELPMILRWQQAWREQGRRADVSLISVDRTAEELEEFRASHPDVPDDRLAEPDALSPFMQGLGLDPGAGLPLHIFTDDGGRIRCVRAGAVVEDHHPVIERLLGT